MPSSLQRLDDPCRCIPTRTAWVHLPCQSHDSLQSGSREMFAPFHSPTDVGKQLEVSLLTGEQWIRLEMRDDSGDQDGEASALPLQSLVAPVWSESAATEVFLNDLEDFRAITVLTDRQTRPHFPADDHRRSW